MSNQQYSTVSIIVCSFNGGRGIGTCLEGIAAQKYPKDKITTIVVDDGSTDDTAAIAKRYDVQVITHVSNMGVQHARNTGFSAATGDFIVYLDDDCAVSDTWLSELIAPFSDTKVVGVGGQVVAYSTKRLAERFMEATGYGNPEPLSAVAGDVTNLVRRVRVYIQSMYRPLGVPARPIEAQAVYTANVAYRLSALKAIDGFDSTLRSNEDSDVASRLRAAGGKLMFAPFAVARHRHHTKVWHVIRQTFFRAGDTYQYYRKNHMLPPLFPFPVLYTMIASVLMIALPLAGLLFALLGPILLYNSWVFHAAQARNVEYAFYAYIQFFRESAALLGFLRGALADSEHRSVVGAYATRNAAGSNQKSS